MQRNVIEVGRNNSSILLAPKFDISSLFLDKDTRNVAKITEQVIDILGFDLLLESKS